VAPPKLRELSSQTALNSTLGPPQGGSAAATPQGSISITALARSSTYAYSTYVKKYSTA
jgi:hypothetical protein